VTQIKARELSALRLYLRLGAAIHNRDWETVRDLADELAVNAMHIIRKEKKNG
jgi:hypothetical protein